MKGSDSQPHRGPLLIASRDEAARIYEALIDETDDVARALVIKCKAVLIADPSWRKPLR